MKRQAATSNGTSRPRRRIALALASSGVLGAALVAGLAILLPRAPLPPASVVNAPTTRPAAATESSEPAGQVAAAAVAWSLRPGFRRGDFLEYRFSQKRSVHMIDVRMPGSGAQRPAPETIGMTLEYSGVLTVKVYEEDGDGWTMGFEVADAKSRVSSPNAEALQGQASLPESGMGGEVLAQVSSRGEVERIFFPPETPPFVRDYWREVLARWQVVYPEDPSRAEWEEEETDTTGRYVAVYRCEAPGTRAHLTKTKVAYTAAGHGGAESSTDVVEVEGRAEIRVDPRPEAIEGWERVQIHSGEFFKGIDSYSKFSYRRVRQETRRHAGGDLADRLRSRAASSLASERTSQHSEPIPEGVDIHSELREVQALLAGGRAKEGETTLHMRRLVDLMRRDPEAVKAVLERLEDASSSDDLAAMLIGSLGAAGTEPAQEALRRIIGEMDWADNRRHMAIFAFVEVETPIPQMDATLERLYEERGTFAGNSLRLLGAVGSKVKESDPERFARTEAYLRQQAGDPGLGLPERTAALHSLGNLEPSETPPELTAASEDASPRVRQAAVQALGGIRDPEASRILEAAARSDSSEEVRLQAVRVLASRETEEAAGILRELLLNDGAESVREAALAGLARNYLDDPSVREVVSLVGSTDRSESVRALAAEVLESET